MTRRSRGRSQKGGLGSVAIPHTAEMRCRVLSCVWSQKRVENTQEVMCEYVFFGFWVFFTSFISPAFSYLI